MKNVLKIAYYELLRNIRDYRMLLILVITPIILIFILGKSLTNFLNMDYLEKPIVAVVNLDEGEVGAQLNDYLNQSEIQSMITMITYDDQATANLAMDDDVVSCVIFIPSDLSENIAKDKPANIMIDGKKDTNYAESMMNRFVNRYNLYHAMLLNGKTIENGEDQGLITRGELNSQSVYPDSMDYYAVQTTLQILVLIAIFGINMILRDYQDGMHIRTSNLPIKRAQILSGRILGSIFYGFIAATTTILFSSLAYGANWNGNIGIISLSILLFVIIYIGIGVILAHITKKFSSAFGILAVISMVFPTAAGAFSPKTTIKPVAVFSPNYYVKNIIFGTVYDLPSSIIIQNFIGLLIILLVVIVLIIFFEGRRKYEHFQA